MCFMQDTELDAMKAQLEDLQKEAEQIKNLQVRCH